MTRVPEKGRVPLHRKQLLERHHAPLSQVDHPANDRLAHLQPSLVLLYRGEELRHALVEPGGRVLLGNPEEVMNVFVIDDLARLVFVPGRGQRDHRAVGIAGTEAREPHLAAAMESGLVTVEVILAVEIIDRDRLRQPHAELEGVQKNRPQQLHLLQHIPGGLLAVGAVEFEIGRLVISPFPTQARINLGTVGGKCRSQQGKTDKKDAEPAE